jgi:hypothetical protein
VLTLHSIKIAFMRISFSVAVVCTLRARPRHEQGHGHRHIRWRRSFAAMGC